MTPAPAQTGSTSFHIPMHCKDGQCSLNSTGLRSSTRQSRFPAVPPARVAQKQGASPCHVLGAHRDKTPVTTSTTPQEGAPSQDVSAPPNPAAAPQRAHSMAGQGSPTGTEGTYSRDSAWLFWKRSSGRVCSWLRFSRLQGRRKRSGFGGQSNHTPPCNPSGVLWLTERGQPSPASHLGRTPLSQARATNGALIDLLTTS